MDQTITDLAPDISSGHLLDAAVSGVGAIPGVEAVEVDLGSKRVVVSGERLEGDEGTGSS